MPKKEGICKNIDCDNFNKPVEVEPGEEFVCPICHKPLREKNGGKKGRQVKRGSDGRKMAGIIVVAVAVLVGIVYFVPRADKTGSLPPVDTDTITVPPPEPNPSGGTGPEQGPVGVGGGIGQPLATYGTVDLGYASYTGDLKDGKPHGHGTLTYKVERRIVSSKDFIAKPGDTFEGEFRNGRISAQGYWKHDGNTVLVKP